MLEKERFYRPNLTKKIFLIFQIILFLLFFISKSLADLKLQENLVKKINETETLTFNFIQKIEDKEEFGKCFIKYPLLMKCNYKNLKKKSIISNGKTFAIIKKKYKKIYYYPLKATMLFIILKKENLTNLVKNNYPIKRESNIIEYQLIDTKVKNQKKIRIFFDKESLELKGWSTKDVYENHVSFMISDLKFNQQISNDFFKIPKEEDL